MVRTIVRRLRRRIIRALAPEKWRCPSCRGLRRWGGEHAIDLYPMLLDMHSMPTCCLQAFPLWAYGGRV